MRPYSITAALTVTVTVAMGVSTRTTALDYELKLEVVLPRIKGRGKWFQPRPGAMPGLGEAGKPLVVMTIQKSLGSDHLVGTQPARGSRELGRLVTGLHRA